MCAWRPILTGYCKPWNEGGAADNALTDAIRCALCELDRLQAIVDAWSVPCDGTCVLCGKPVESLSGNPSRWPVHLCDTSDPGKPKLYCTGCVSQLVEAGRKLPLTADGVRVVPGMRVWVPCNEAGYYGQLEGEPVEFFVVTVSTQATPLETEHRDGTHHAWLAERCYSTREAAEAAKGGRDAKRSL